MMKGMPVLCLCGLLLGTYPVSAQDSLAVSGKDMQQVQVTPCHWNIRFGLGWFGVAQHSGFYPNINIDGEYLFPYGIRTGVEVSYFHRRLPSDYRYNAFSVSLRGSLYIKALLRKPDPRWDFYAGTGIGCHWFLDGALKQPKVQCFVPVYIGTKVRLVPNWHLSLELAFNDVSAARLAASRQF